MPAWSVLLSGTKDAGIVSGLDLYQLKVEKNAMSQIFALWCNLE
jgi:hypothetical protein